MISTIKTKHKGQREMTIKFAKNLYFPLKVGLLYGFSFFCNSLYFPNALHWAKFYLLTAEEK
jgi:hypothetical protein